MSTRARICGPNVRMIMRKSGRGFSIERIFRDITRELASRMTVEMAEAPYESMGLVNRWRDLRWASRCRADVFHVTGDIQYVTLGLPRHKCVLTVHDCISLHRLQGWRRELLLRMWYKWPIRHCHIVTAISHFAASELELLGIAPRDRIRVIHDPIGPEFRHDPRPFSEARPTVLHLGASPHKNLIRLAEALRGIPCHLKIVGRLRPEQLSVLGENRIDFTAESNVTDARLLKLYRDADLVAFVSTYEGFGMPIIEAQATGRPVVTSCVASMPEVAGNAACLVDPFDVDSIREGVLRVIRDRHYREHLVAEGLRNRERFEVSRIARQYEKVYREVWRPS